MIILFEMGVQENARVLNNILTFNGDNAYKNHPKAEVEGQTSATTAESLCPKLL